MPTKHLATRIRAKISTEPCGLITPGPQTFSASLSGFAYLGNSNATVLTGSGLADVNWNRYGIAAHLRYKMFDLHGMYTSTAFAHVPTAMANFDKSASGLSVALDTYVTTHTLLSLRYDNMDAAVISVSTSQSFLGMGSNSTCGPTWPCSLETISTCDGQKTATRQPVIYDTPFSGIDIAY